MRPNPARGSEDDPARKITPLPGRGGGWRRPAEPAEPERHRDNLPAEFSSFVGRESEIAEVAELLATHRLVTLSGAPGVGKTRLALRAAEEVRDRFGDGVWLVELAALAEPTLVPAAVADARGVRDQGGRPLLEALADYLRPRGLLLVLDNCEHLLDACAALAETLLAAVPGLQVLATSRVPLGLLGELAWTVPPLTLPEAAGAGPGRAGGGAVRALLTSEAGRLFAERARAARPAFELTPGNAAAVAEVCRRVDGLPLAIELAAARLSVLSAVEIAARLDDRFTLLTGGSRTALPRQRTLRALVDWSHALLSESERVLFRRLSVFAGGWTLQAAKAVCGTDEGRRTNDEGSTNSSFVVRPSSVPRPSAVLDLLTGLVDKSLVLAEERDGEVRYRLLETLRQYGQEKLREAGEEAAVRGRHLRCLLELAERGAPQLSGLLEAAWCDRVEAEMDNVRAALGWARDAGAAAVFAAPGPPALSPLEAALRLAAAMYWVWGMRGYAAEGRAWLEQLLALEQQSSDRAGPDPTLARRRALCALGILVFLTEAAGPGTRLIEESDALAAAAGDRRGRVFGLGVLGMIATAMGQLDRATELLEEALAMARAEAMPSLVSGGLFWLGEVARLRGDLDGAERLLDECIAVAREFDVAFGAGDALSRLARIAAARGDHARAVILHREALAAHRPIDYRVGQAITLEELSWDLVTLRQADRAALMLGAAAALRERIGITHPPIADWQAMHEAATAAARQALGEDAFEAAHERGRRLPLAEALDLALLADGPRTLSSATGPDVREDLTPREREIAGLVARGLSNQQIAETLAVSERTVEWHVRNLLGKLGLSARTQLAVWAVQHGLRAPQAE